MGAGLHILWKQGWHGRANGVVGEACEAFGKETVVGKFGNVVGPANLNQPAVFDRQDHERRDFESRNNDQRLEMPVKCPDMSGRNEQANFRGWSIPWLVVAATNHGRGAEFMSFAVGIRFGFSGREKNREKEHGQSENGGDIAAPEAKGENNESGAKDA